MSDIERTFSTQAEAVLDARLKSASRKVVAL